MYKENLAIEHFIDITLVPSEKKLQTCTYYHQPNKHWYREYTLNRGSPCNTVD